jgi:hypothetical protein
MEPLGVSDTFGGQRLKPGIWGVEARRSAGTLRLRSRLGYPMILRLRPPTGEICVDFATGTPSRGVLWIPLLPNAGSVRWRGRWRLVERLFETARFPEAALRLYTGCAQGTSRWSASAILTLGGMNDRADVQLRQDYAAPAYADGFAGLMLDVQLNAGDFTAAGPARRVPKTMTLRLRLVLSMATPW